MLRTSRLWIVALVSAGLLLAGVTGCEKTEVTPGEGVETPAIPATGPSPALPLPPKALTSLDKLAPPVSKPVNPGEIRPMSPQASDAMAEGEKAIAAGDLNKAIDRFERARDFEPNNPKVRRSLAMAWAARGDLAKALDNLRQALKAAPDDLESQLMLGKILAAQDRDGAITAFRTAMVTTQATPDNRLAAEALMNLAALLQERGDWTAALDAYDQLGQWIEKHGRNYTAPKSLRELALRPERLQTVRGQLLVQLRRPAEAVEPLRKSFESNRTDLSTARLLLEALIATRQYPQAEKLLIELAGETTQGAQLWMLAEKLCRTANDASMPSRIWQGFRKKNQISPMLAVALASISERLGKSDEAVAILRSVTEAMPGNLPASNALAGVYARRHEFGQAIDVLAEEVRRNPQVALEIAEGVRQVTAGGLKAADITRYATSRTPASTPGHSEPALDFAQKFALAMLDLDLRENASALRFLDQVIAEKKDFLPAYEAEVDFYMSAGGEFDKARAVIARLPEQGYFANYLLGKIQLSAGKLPDATRSFEAVRKAEPKYVPNLLLLADAYSRQRQGDSAANALQSAIDADPNESRAYRRLFEIYVQSRQYAEAQTQIGRMLERQPQNLQGMIMLAELNMAINQRSTAANIIQQLLEQAPENAEVNLLAARAELTVQPGMVSKGQFDRAMRYIDAALKGDARDVRVLRIKAELLAQPGRFEQVAAVWKQLYDVSPKEEYARLYGGALMLAHQYKQACDALLPLVEKYPDVALRQALIESLSHEGKFERALALLQGWIKQAASAPATAPDAAGPDKLALAFYRQRLLKLYEDAYDKKPPSANLKTDVAMKIIDDWAASVDPDMKAALLREKIRLFCMAGEFDKAASQAELVSEEPNKGSARQVLLAGLIQAKQYDRAIGLADKWMPAGAGSDTDMERFRGIKMEALTEAGRFDAAEQFAKDWLKLVPPSAGARLFLIDGLMQAKQFDRAQKMIESWLPDLPALASMPAAGTVEPAKVAEAIRHSYVRVLVLKEKFADALKLIDQYLDKSPNDKVLLNLKSTCLSELGRPAESIKVLEKVLGLEPDDAGANNNLGYNLAEQGVQLEKAEKMLRKALENRPGEPSFMDSLGWILYREGRYHEAASQLREVIFSEEEAAQHPVIFDHAGDAFWRLGWTAEAARFWEKAIELCGKEPVMSGETRQVQAKASAKLKAYQQKKAPEIAPPAAPETPASAPTSKPASKPASAPATKAAQ